MVRPISFAKEPSHFLENNPQSWCVQKNLQFGPEINTQPLSYLDFEPAVQPFTFCELDPRTKVSLRFSPRFSPETPWNISFLTNRSLELVFSLDYAF